jgi:hypothetical protein
MQRYLLFCFDYYYPSGGFNDFNDDFNNIEDAKKGALESGYDHFQIIDSLDGATIEEC